MKNQEQQVASTWNKCPEDMSTAPLCCQCQNYDRMRAADSSVRWHAGQVQGTLTGATYAAPGKQEKAGEDSGRHMQQSDGRTSGEQMAAGRLGAPAG